MTRKNLIMPFSMVTLMLGLVAVASWSGCSVGLDPDQPGIYYCESDEDCIQPQYTCDTTENLCVFPGANNPTCVDEDEDGYTVDGNAACPNPGVVDCDDNNSEVNPGEPEICDGEDNDCDEDVDEPVMCDGAADCPSGDAPNGTIFGCGDSSEVCEVKPLKSGTMGCDIILKCVDGSYEELPEMCQ